MLTIRRFSSWITGTAKSKATTSIDVEALFLDNRVQEILKRVNGLSTTKVFRFRQYPGQSERVTYRLMTQEAFDKAQEQAAEHAKPRLQIPPFKHARVEESKLIAHDQEIAGHDTAKMVFFDISPGLKLRDRLVVIRETDGRLRTGTAAERDRLHRTYFPVRDKPVTEPRVFEEPFLTEALNRGKYEFVLDYACWYLEPDDPKYIMAASTVYDHVDSNSMHEALWSTRHYGALVFYLVINKRIDNLLVACLNKRKLAESADLVRLYRICHKDCKTADVKDDLDLVKNFAKSDSNNRQYLENVIQAFEEAIRNETQLSSEGKTVGLKSSSS